MLSKSLDRFLRDERGSYTVWSLVWFMLYVAIGGLAVDATDAYNKQTLLQATADSAALAGVMSIGVTGEDPVDEALAYAGANMASGIHGNVLVDTDVHIGFWNFGTETFTEVPAYDPTLPISAVNAVYVVTRRSTDNANPVAMNFLRILGLFGFKNPWWDIVTEAVAVKYLPECLQHSSSLIAGNKVDVTSNNEFNDVCIHGQNMILDNGEDLGFDIQNNGTIGDGVEISVPGPDDADSKPYVCSNDGYCEEGTVVLGDTMPLEAFAVGDAIDGMLDPNSTYLVQDVYSTNADGTAASPNYVEINLKTDCDGTFCVEVPPQPEYDADGNLIPPPPGSSTYEYIAAMDPNTVYVIRCEDAGDQFILPSPDVQPVLQEVGVMSECRIKGHSDMNLQGVTLASSAVLGSGSNKPYDKATIHFPAGTDFGASNCDPSGDVWIYSASSIHVSAGGSFTGVHMIARGDIELTANESATQLSVWAGEDIRMTANADFDTTCAFGDNQNVAWRYRLVR